MPVTGGRDIGFAGQVATTLAVWLEWLSTIKMIVPLA